MALLTLHFRKKQVLLDISELPLKQESWFLPPSATPNFSNTHLCLVFYFAPRGQDLLGVGQQFFSYRRHDMEGMVIKCCSLGLYIMINETDTSSETVSTARTPSLSLLLSRPSLFTPSLLGAQPLLANAA